MSKLLPPNATTLTKALGEMIAPSNSVRRLLCALLKLNTRSDAQLVWLAKLCKVQPSDVLADPACLKQCQTTQLIALIDVPEFCSINQLDEIAAQIPIEQWSTAASESEKRTLVKSACVRNDARLLISSLWNPFLCPTELLPWLAWSVSVDEWDEAWSESLKRQVIADAFAVHQVKGTPYALQKALDSLNIKTEIREWWQGDNPEELARGTVQVWALINSNLDEHQQGMLTPQMLKRVRRIVESVKRGAIHIDVQLGLAFSESTGVTGVASTAILQRADAPIGEGVKPPSMVQSHALIGAKSTCQSGHFAIAGKGVVPPHSQGANALSGVTGLGQSAHIAIEGRGVVPPQSRGPKSITGATNTHQSSYVAMCATGVKPAEVLGTYGAFGGMTNHLFANMRVFSDGVLPSGGTGNEYLVSATRQIIFQHFNLQGAA
ncbi:phage tail protein I [Pseudoalteromonas sp. SMS1]|uniref:phage tail protein I n=1 Tax=Pseudoalteromonas sp. SMS1 TaxID=2908894 RepID=UPI001F249D52|nr:phage tail protein I [Pseudoalteromonas sp. SMS1]MCF2856459.1 phage tail protein I [Pseudoalteromonas sp. SMS1]